MNRIVVALILPVFTVSCAVDRERNYSGVYAYGPEVHSFKPCNQGVDYWVSYNWAGLEMHEYYQQSKKAPYQLMYIEFRGQVLNEVVDGFAMDYDGLIRISEVHKYSFEIPATCRVER